MIACKICILRKGLRSDDIKAGTCDYVFKTEDELEKHLFKIHGVRTAGKK